jgi:hypothetical protein
VAITRAPKEANLADRRSECNRHLRYDGRRASPTCQRRWPLWQPRARTSRLYADHFSSMRPYFQIDSAITQVSTNNATIA